MSRAAEFRTELRNRAVTYGTIRCENLSFIHSFIVHETDRVYNHDVEDKNIISVVGSLAIAGQISLLSNAIKLHKNNM